MTEMANAAVHKMIDQRTVSWNIPDSPYNYALKNIIT